MPPTDDRIAASVSSLVNVHRSGRASLLPAGDAFHPVWRPREDMTLGDGMILSGLKSFEVLGLRRTMAMSDPEARETIEMIMDHMAAKVGGRTADDIIFRFFELQAAYGTAPSHFHRFKMDAKHATDAEAANDPSPKAAGKRPRAGTSPAAAPPTGGSASSSAAAPMQPPSSSSRSTAGSLAAPPPPHASAAGAARPDASRAPSSLSRASCAALATPAQPPSRPVAAAATTTATTTRTPTGGAPVSQVKRLKTPASHASSMGSSHRTPAPPPAAAFGAGAGAGGAGAAASAGLRSTGGSARTGARAPAPPPRAPPH